MRTSHPALLVTLAALGGCAGQARGDRTGNEQELGLELGAALSAGLERSSGPLPGGFSWPVPDGWSRNASPFPPPFAPDLAGQGLEESRLAPGYLEAGAPGFRTSGFVWWLGGKPQVGATATFLARELSAYDRGLVSRAAKVPVQVDLAQLTADLVPLGDFAQGRPVRIFGGGVDVESSFTRGLAFELAPPRTVRVFTGRASTVDGLATGKDLRLHLLVSVFDCPVASHRAVLVLASPQPLKSTLWLTLVELAARFRCR